MITITKATLKTTVAKLSVGVFAFAIGLGTSTIASADEADAKALLKAMSDYMASQEAISFAYDASFEVVTKDGQRLSLASSGTMALNRPDKLHVTRSGGFMNNETIFDGQTLTLLGKNVNLYTQVEVKGTIDNLLDTMIGKLGRTPPAADLISSNAYDQLMENVVDIKDLGSGVINGVECDFLAFRTEDVDWQIWIAHGDQPYPCRYVVTSKQIDGAPQYSIQFRDWETGKNAVSDDFIFSNTTDAKMIDPADLKEKMGDLPSHFKTGG